MTFLLPALILARLHRAFPALTVTTGLLSDRLITDFLPWRTRHPCCGIEPPPEHTAAEPDSVGRAAA